MTSDLPDLTDPIWTIAHVARAFGVEVDSAREYTYRDDFPGARRVGARLLWSREEILAWFHGLSKLTARDRRRGPTTGTHSTGPRRATASRAATYRPRQREGVAS